MYHYQNGGRGRITRAAHQFLCAFTPATPTADPTAAIAASFEAAVRAVDALAGETSLVGAWGLAIVPPGTTPCRVSTTLLGVPESSQHLVVILLENMSAHTPLVVSDLWVASGRTALQVQMRAYARGLGRVWPSGPTRVLTRHLPTRIDPGEAAVVDLPFESPGMDWGALRQTWVDVSGGSLVSASRRNLRAFRRAVADEADLGSRATTERVRGGQQSVTHEAASPERDSRRESGVRLTRRDPQHL